MCVCNISLYGLSPFHHKALVSANTFKFWNLLFSVLSGTKIRNEYNQVPRLYFFSRSAEILLKFWYWIIFRPQNQMGNRPVRHTVLKQLEKNVDSTSRRWFKVGWMLDQLCLPNWQALSVAKLRLLCWILNSLTSRQKLFYRFDKSCSNCWKTKT